jgi:hypothetical protein
MFKINQKEKSLDCDICNRCLVDPIVLACGSIICKSHTDSFNNDCAGVIQLKPFWSKTAEKTFVCIKCKNSHTVPESGFVVNDRIQTLLTNELNVLKAGPIFNDCVQIIDQTREHFEKFKTFEKSSEDYIYAYFEDIKTKVKSRNESLKLEIDNASDNINKSIENSQTNLINMSKVKLASANIEEVKVEMDTLVMKLVALGFNDDKLKNTKKRLFVIHQELVRNFNSISLLDNKEYSFQFEEISLRHVFGNFVNIPAKVQVSS